MSGNVLGDILSKRVKEFTHEKGWNIEILAEKSNLPYQTVRNVWYGKTPDPHVSTVLQLAKALEVGMNCLLGRCQHTTEEKALLRNFRACGNHGKGLISYIARYEATVTKSEREKLGARPIPCLVPQNRVDEGFTYEDGVTIDIETTNPKALMAVQITSNIYTPKYCKGDKVLLTDIYPEDGEIAFFLSNGVGFAREYHEVNGKHVLKCLIGNREDMVLHRLDEIFCLGTVIGVIRAE